MFNQKIYGWLPDIPDQRDFLCSAIKPKIRIPRKAARIGIANMPRKSERVIGGHAVMAAGYNQKERRFLIRNSWGVKWDQSGYFTMPFAYLETLAANFWTIRK
jgi:C1A family cysteine protease